MRKILIGLLSLLAGAWVPSPAQARVAVSGACKCPTPANVEKALGQVDRGAPESRSEGTSPERYDAVLTCAVGGMVEVVLQSDGGGTIADRAIAARGSCRDRAAAVAVIIGAWEADIDPHISPSVTLPAVSTRPQPAPPPSAVVSQSGPGSRVASGAAPTAARPDRSGALRLSAAVGLLASFTGGQVVPGAIIAADVLPQGGHLGVAATVTATTSHDSSVGSLNDVVRWSRVTLGVGPDVRLGSRPARLDLQVQGVVAALSVGGSGLPSTSSDSSLQLGGALALRSGWAWETSAIWAAMQVLVFPGNDRLLVQGVADQGRLPQIELQLAAGLSLGLFP